MNTAIVSPTAATVSPFIQNLQQQQPQKPQASKEAIAANVKALIEQLEEGHSEGLTAYLMAMGRFHNYSFGNILEIARQKPSATRVAGMYAWNQLGRRVNHQPAPHLRGCGVEGTGSEYQSPGRTLSLASLPAHRAELRDRRWSQTLSRRADRRGRNRLLAYSQPDHTGRSQPFDATYCPRLLW